MVDQKFSILGKKLSRGKKDSHPKENILNQNKKSRAEKKFSWQKKMFHAERICPSPTENFSQQNKEEVKGNSD